MPTFGPPKKNTAFVCYVGLVSQADPKTLQANPTLAAGDVKVAVDDAAPANLATLPAVDADFTKRVKVSLSAAEMNGDNISIIFSDAAGGEWCDFFLSIQTTTKQIDDLALTTEVPTAIQNADALLDRNMATGVDSGSPSVRTPRQALRFLRNRWGIAAGTLTVRKEDDTTASWTAAVTTTPGNPLDSVDPAS